MDCICHTNKTNGKKYVGQTCRSLEIRSGTKGQGYKRCSHFWNAICKYGWDNFEHEILFENLTHEKANKFEKLLIQILRTQNPEYGYNIQNGGVEGNGVPIEDLTGKRFGRLTVIGRDYTRADGVYWLCKCDCGKKTSACTYDLNSSKKVSCGCYNRELIANLSTVHGMTGHPLHSVWLNVKENCKNPNHKFYLKGISICSEWNDFMNFYNWAINNGYKKGLSLSRKDCNQNFSPENCEWVTRQEISRRRDNNRICTFNNRTMTLPEWADELQIDVDTLRFRLDKTNMTIEEAFTKPLKKKKYYEYNGEIHSIKEWSDIYHIKLKTLQNRLYRGKTIEEALAG